MQSAALLAAYGWGQGFKPHRRAQRYQVLAVPTALNSPQFWAHVALGVLGWGHSEIVTGTAAIRYRAFLSYSHRDSAWCKWLHSALERYRIDKDLIGRESPSGPVPKTLRPIFRDREDFSGGHKLTDATIAALDASACLIVLCSTVSAGRPSVNEEVRLFRSRHPDRPVIPVIVEGMWPENFPPALRYDLAPDGSITDRPITILGPDLRDSGDGKSLGLAKVIAGLTGISTDDVFRRAERARKRRNRFWVALAGVFLALAIIASGSAVYAWQQLKTNESFLNATLKTATDIVNTAVTQAENYNVPRTATLELLAKAEVLFGDIAQYGRPTPQLRYRKAWMLIQFARNYAIVGDSEKQRARAREAQRLLTGLADEKSGDIDYLRSLATAHQEVGDVLVAQGSLAEALKAFQDGVAIIERLAKTDPGNGLWQAGLAASYQKIGDVLLEQGNLREAVKYFSDVLTIMDRLAKANPDDASAQADLSVAYERVGDVLVAQGNLPVALNAFRDSFAIRDRLAKANSANIALQRHLAVSYFKIGEVLSAQGNLPEALKSFRDGLAIIDRLAKADPSNRAWQRDLWFSYAALGNIQFQQADLAAALISCQSALDIISRLAAADPKNTGWQRDLSVSYNRTGDALAAQGKLGEALEAYREGLAIAERLAAADHSNKQWQRDLQFSIGRIGSLAYRFVLAHEFGMALEVAEKAIALAPDQIWLSTNRAHALLFLGRVEEARTLYLHYRGKKNVQDGKLWETIILEDFADLRKAGLTHPLMDEIEKRFAAGG